MHACMLLFLSFCRWQWWRLRRCQWHSWPQFVQPACQSVSRGHAFGDQARVCYCLQLEVAGYEWGSRDQVFLFKWALRSWWSYPADNAPKPSPAFSSFLQLSPAFSSFLQLSPAFSSFLQLSPLSPAFSAFSSFLQLSPEEDITEEATYGFCIVNVLIVQNSYDMCSRVSWLQISKIIDLFICKSIGNTICLSNFQTLCVPKDLQRKTKQKHTNTCCPCIDRDSPRVERVDKCISDDNMLSSIV